jgi:MFS family permease
MLIIFLTALGLFGAVLYIPLFAQYVTGISATNSGTLLTPMMLGLIVSSVASGQIITRTGRYKWLAILGLAVSVSALYWLSLIGTGTTHGGLLARMVVLGAGLGLTMPIFNLAVQNAFSQNQLGVVTAATQLFRNIGGTVGTALMAAVLNSQLSKHLASLSSDPFVKMSAQGGNGIQPSDLDGNKIQGLLSPQGRGVIEAKIQALPQVVQPIAHHAFGDCLQKIQDAFALSIAHVFYVATVLMFFALVASFWLKEIPLRTSHKEEPALREAGIELAEELGEAPAAHEPRTRSLDSIS